MSIDINYCDTFLSALSKNYTSGDYVRTFGFASVGDGGAGLYEYRVDPAQSFSRNDVEVYYKNGIFCNRNHRCFKLIPQYGKVYAEQFGVLPGDTAFAAGNIKMLKNAVTYAAKNSCELTFASGGVYYLNPGSITVPSGMHIDGNGATLQIYDNNHKEVNLFNSSSPVNDVSIHNITLIGRRIAADAGYTDQAIHIKCSNLTVQNVRFKFFEYAFHTYGGDAVGEIKTETKTYDIVDIPNKNWLIDSCKTESCIFGINTSEIDGLVIKDSDISCYTTSNDTAHCVYLSSNCSNVRVVGCSLREVSGDAIHKVYSGSDKFDLSKNHFYTDLSIHNADSALDIGFISQNVMCDNVFATEVDVALQLSAADNCIVSNSYFGQHEESSKSTTFIYAGKACNCWLQNSYAYYKGQHRVTYEYQESNMLSTVFKDKKHRRMFIGPDFDIPNHWFKFTGCVMKSDYETWSSYFSAVNSKVTDKTSNYFGKPFKTNYGEYWDNCSYICSTDQEVFRLYCINDSPQGITIRNSYLRNTNLTDRTQPPFIYACNYMNSPSDYYKNVCPIYPDSCVFSSFGKTYPWIRFENNIYEYRFSIYETWKKWLYYTKKCNMSVDQFVKLTGSYSSNCHRKNISGECIPMDNLMA